MKKILLSILCPNIFVLILSILSAMNCANLMSLDVDCKTNIHYISLNNEFTIPLEVAKLSNFLNTCLECQNIENTISLELNIEYKDLEPLIKALSLIHKFKNLLNSKQLYEKIQNNLKLNLYSLEELSILFEKAVYLDSPLLENVFADYFAQLMNQDNFNDIANLIDSDYWYLIEKFYYLRSDTLKVTRDILLFKKSNKLINDLKNDEIRNPAFILINIVDTIIYNMNLSIQDLLDYNKNISVENHEIQGKRLDLEEFKLISLNGLNNIDNIENNRFLYLSNNLLKELFPNNFINCHNLDCLILRSNAIQKIYKDAFIGLDKLTELDLTANPIVIDIYTFEHLTNLKELNLSFTGISEIGSRTFEVLNNLVILLLNNCGNLTILRDNAFKGLKNLNLLYIQDNFLKKIETDALLDLDNLKKLSLPHSFPCDPSPLTEESKQVLIRFKEQHPQTETYFLL